MNSIGGELAYLTCMAIVSALLRWILPLFCNDLPHVESRPNEVRWVNGHWEHTS